MKTNINWLRNLTSYQKYSKRKLDERWNKHKKIFDENLAKKDVEDMDWRELHYIAKHYLKE